MAKARKSRRGRKARKGSTAAPGLEVVRTSPTFGPIHKFMRVDRPGDVPLGVADQGYVQTFIASDLPNWTEFSALYEHFRIDSVEVQFILDIADGSLNSTTYYPRIAIAPDWNDSTAPSTEDQILQYQQAKVVQFSSVVRQFSYTIKPKLASAVFLTPLSTAYQVMPAGFLDTAFGATPHYGIKFFVSNHNSTSFGSSRIRQYIKYNLTMANPK